MSLPSSKKLVWPIIQVLKGRSPILKTELDGSIAELFALSSDQLQIRHDGSRSEFQYRSAWALSYGKKAGYLENPARNQWAITSAGRAISAESELKF